MSKENVLEALKNEHDKMLSVRELCDALQRNRQSVYKYIDVLEAEGKIRTKLIGSAKVAMLKEEG